MTDQELLDLPPVEVGHNHQRNPFADRLMAGDETAGPLAKRWSRLHGWTVEESATVEDDPLALLAGELAIMDTGWYHHEHAQTGALTLFPFEAADADDWERRCQEMHDGQELITLEDKPTENHYLRRPLHHTARSQPTEPVRFEDTPESAKLRGVIRGDL